MSVIIFESLTKLPHARFYPRSPEKGVSTCRGERIAATAASASGVWSDTVLDAAVGAWMDTVCVVGAILCGSNTHILYDIVFRGSLP